MVVYYHGAPMNSVAGLASNVWYEESDLSQTNLQTKLTDMITSESQLSHDVGNVSNLQTSNKIVVPAINEVRTTANTTSQNVGNLTQLTTTNKSTVVAAINELVGKVANVGIKQVITLNASGTIPRGGGIGSISTVVNHASVNLAKSYVIMTKSDISTDGIEPSFMSRTATSVTIGWVMDRGGESGPFDLSAKVQVVEFN